MKYRMTTAAAALAMGLSLGYASTASAQGGVPARGVEAATSGPSAGQKSRMQNKTMMKRSSKKKMKMMRNGGGM